MERLTRKERTRTGKGVSKDTLIDRDFDRLSEYCINILTKLADYEDLEEQGRLIKLPCKVGNTVYRYVEEKGCVLEYTVWNISMSAYESGGIDIVIEGCAESEDEVEDEFSLSLIDFKNEFFNTKSEAEQKLKEMESD